VGIYDSPVDISSAIPKRKYKELFFANLCFSATLPEKDSKNMSTALGICETCWETQ
jgi:hypothetical protein